MNRKSLLITTLVIAIAGLIFSGYLSYYNLFTDGCSEALITCGGSDPVLIFGQPTCIYGFFMYLIVIILTITALVKDKKRPLQKSIFVVGLIGVLFSGSLSVYELFFRGTEFTELPACVYGFIIYLGIFIAIWLSLSKKYLQIDKHVETELTVPKEEENK